MVVDRLENAQLYAGLGSRFAAAFAFLRRSDLKTLEPGKYPIDGDDVFAIVARGTTKPREQGVYEAHRKYHDVQYIVDGPEAMGYANLKDLAETKAYDAEGDYLLLNGKGNFIEVKPGMFTIFTPQDAHMPGAAVDAPAEVLKVVVKVRV